MDEKRIPEDLIKKIADVLNLEKEELLHLIAVERYDFIFPPLEKWDMTPEKVMELFSMGLASIVLESAKKSVERKKLAKELRSFLR